MDNKAQNNLFDRLQLLGLFDEIKICLETKKHTNQDRLMTAADL